MLLKKLINITLVCFSLTIAAHANQVLLVVNQPLKVGYQIAHKNQGQETKLGALHTIELNKNTTIPIELGQYDLAGLIIVSINNHELPPSANQFNQPKQCSMTTNKDRATGALTLAASNHAIRCRTFGGIFG